MTWHTLRPPPSLRPNLFLLQYNPNSTHRPPPVFPWPLPASMRSQHEGVSRLAARAPYGIPPQLPFAWKVMMYKSAAPKRVVRSWCCRRLKVAITLALKERVGVDADGRPLRTSGDEDIGGLTGKMPKGRELKGEASLLCHAPLVLATWSTLKRQADCLVDRMEEIDRVTRAREGIGRLGRKSLEGPAEMVRRETRGEGKPEAGATKQRKIEMNSIRDTSMTKVESRPKQAAKSGVEKEVTRQGLPPAGRTNATSGVPLQRQRR